MKNMNKLAERVAFLEGHKKSLNIAQIKEVLRIVSQLCVRQPQVIALLIKNGSKKRR